MSTRQRITLLGATGSIGQSTLDVIALDERYQVFAMTARHNVAAMLELCRRFRPVYAVMSDPSAGEQLSAQMAGVSPDTQVLVGEKALVTVAAHPDVDCVMAAIVGAAGLLPTLEAARQGKKVLLANKEALIMAGPLFMQAVRDNAAVLLPIDSEHNAIFQCLPESGRLPGRMSTQRSWRRIILTASGGPFLDRPLEELASVTVEQACRHPNWSMGRKISVDSATMMNKGLELIEACYLFDVTADQVDVLIHPQSIVHSLVEYCDGSVLAQLGSPDMRVPIAHALAWPDRMPSGADFLDLVAAGDLQFRAADLQRFPCLRLGREAAKAGSESIITLNAANEVAVEAFLEGHIGFAEIPVIIERCLGAVRQEASCTDMLSVEQILRVDHRARTMAGELLGTAIRS